MKKSMAMLILVFFSPIITAINGYQFELIIFSHITKESYQSEKWPKLNSIALDIDTLMTQINPLAPQYYHLAKEQMRLSNNPNYRSLMHIAWIETREKLNKPVTLHLYGGRLFNEDGKIIADISDESRLYSIKQNWEVNGTLTINLARYFDLNFRLLFAEPYQQVKPYLSHSNSKKRFYYTLLQQTRRTRSKQLNYIDHPLYGILMMITPLNT